MKNTKRIFLSLLVMTIVILNIGIKSINAQEAEVVEHVETAEKQISLDLTDGKTGYISVNRENVEEIGYTELYKLVVEESGIKLELTTNEAEAFIKIVKEGQTLYNVMAMNDEAIELSMNVFTFKTKKLVNSIQEDDGVRNDYYLETTYKALIRYGRTEPVLEEIAEVNITIPSPIPGSETNIMEDPRFPGEYNWMTQTNRPEVIVPDNSNYGPVDEYYGEDDDTYTYWICGFDDENYWKPYIGTFEEGKSYIAEFTVFSKPGYKFTNNTVIRVNGQEVEHVFGANGKELWLGQTIKCQSDVEEIAPEEENEEEITDVIEDENPPTGDNYYTHAVMFFASIFVLALTKKMNIIKE